MPEIIPIKRVMPEKLAESTIRRLAEISSRVFFTDHARARMRERHVTFPEVIECIKKGDIKEALHKEASGEWIGKFSRHVAGNEIDVVAKLIERNENEFVLIITVITV